MPIELSALESRRFGVVVARARDADATPAAMDAAADALGVEMLIVRTDCRNHGQVHSVEEHGFRLMDTIVYYERPLDEPPPSLPHAGDVEIRRAEPKDVSAVGDLARAAFANYLGHYHTDPRLDTAAADAGYVEWAENSVGQQSEVQQSILLFSGGRLGGFLVVRRNSPSESEIVLNAVHPDLQRRGYYQRLVVEALKSAQGSGAAKVIVSTQVTNFPVQRAWARLGFYLVGAHHTFHKWYR